MTQRLRYTKLSSIKWHCVCHHDIPKKENFPDCGAFTCMFVCCLAFNNLLNFTQQDIHIYDLCTDNNKLPANLHRFWEVESIGILERSELEEVYQFLNTHVCHSTSSKVNMW